MHQAINSRLSFAFFVTAFAASCGGGTPICDTASPEGCGTGGAGGIGGDGGGSAGFGGFATGGKGGVGGVAGAGGSTFGCTSDSQCGEAQFCEFQNNSCGPVAFLIAPPSGGSSSGASADLAAPEAPPRNTGMCVGRSFACPANFAPVCGCDNKTYSNDCVRQSSGVSKAFDGACEKPTMTVGQGGVCDAAKNLLCAAGLFCEMNAKVCSMRGSSGTCQVSPQQCVAISAPVCGCDGNTYSNDCIRRSKGQSLAHTGACGPTLAGLGESCGVALGISCEKSLVCDPQPNQCTNAKFVGTCRAQASALCTKEFAPVCGCDGRTYSNDCMRLSAGVTKDHDSECKTAQRFIQAGVWGGQHIELIAKQPEVGGSLQFDCGRADITSPLEVDANGNFMWKATYVLQGGPAIAPAPAPIKRDAIITGAVSGNQMKFTVQIAGSMTVSPFGLSLGTPGNFTFCL